MTDTGTTVTLDRREWRNVLSVMEYGILRLDGNGANRTAEARQRLYDDIETQVDEQDSEGRTTLSDVLSSLEDETGIGRSRHVEEIGRTVAHLRD